MPFSPLTHTPTLPPSTHPVIDPSPNLPFLSHSPIPPPLLTPPPHHSPLPTPPSLPPHHSPLPTPSSPLSLPLLTTLLSTPLLTPPFSPLSSPHSLLSPLPPLSLRIEMHRSWRHNLGEPTPSCVVSNSTGYVHYSTHSVHSCHLVRHDIRGLLPAHTGENGGLFYSTVKLSFFYFNVLQSTPLSFFVTLIIGKIIWSSFFFFIFLTAWLLLSSFFNIFFSSVMFFPSQTKTFFSSY